MKSFAVLLGVLVVSSAYADDAALVSSRLTCSEIQMKISELAAVEEPDTVTIDDLTKLKAEYRRSCSRSARGRKTTAGSRVVIEAGTANKEEKQEVKEATSTENTEEVPAVVVEEVVDAVEVVEEVAELTEDDLLEQELANLDAGLCADGTKPNKFGCCGDELFKDLGNTVFACCPKEGGDCFPPIK